MGRFAVLLLLAVISACSRQSTEQGIDPAGTPEATAITKMPQLESARMPEHVKVLSSDEFEGRAPGSKGEELTVQYLEDEFKKIGLRPGNTDGTYIQNLPLVGITGANTTPLTVTGGGRKTTFRWRDDVVAWTRRVTDTASIENSELDLCRLRLTAPEFKWNDFKDVDVKGKTIIVLVNDPQVPDPSDSRSSTRRSSTARR